MVNIVLFMTRSIVADSLIKKLKKNNGLMVTYESNYSVAMDTISKTEPKLILIEASETHEYSVDTCLVLFEKIREKYPGTKNLLMCSEKNKSEVRKTIEAKEKKVIDDFIFYDVSIDYLALKLLLP